MKYHRIVKGKFIERPNRFIAHVEIDGKPAVCHVKNTGRCRELLTEGATVILECADNPTRRTAYDLVAVYKGETLIHLDSQSPNRIFGEWVKTSGYFPNLTLVRPECTYQNSRFDFYIEADGRRIFVEVKGVTLEKDGVVMFPDAPTERGAKHLRELAEAVKEGYEAYVFFVIQMESCKYFTPNRETDPAFAAALEKAAEAGVNLRAVTCSVGEDWIKVKEFAEIRM